MKKNLVVVAAISTFALMGCEKNVVEKISEKSEVLNLKVVSVKPPKRMHMVLEDENGKVYDYRKKRCGNYHAYKVGSVYEIQTTLSTYKEKENEEETHEYRSFSICDKRSKLAEKQF